MLKAILLDMDDTLLDNTEAYHSALIQTGAQYYSDLGFGIPKEFISAVELGFRAVHSSKRTDQTIYEILYSAMAEALGFDFDEFCRLSENYSSQVYPNLQSLAKQLPEARLVVSWALEHGLQVAIASGSLTLRTALEQRLAWAGIPVTDFNYSLLTSLENMHVAKPNPAYYVEILDKLGRKPEECLMVGDLWGQDIVPPASIGIPCFWITGLEDKPHEEVNLLVGKGTLSDLIVWLETHWAENQQQ